jgi:hypothetical protein
MFHVTFAEYYKKLTTSHISNLPEDRAITTNANASYCTQKKYTCIILRLLDIILNLDTPY